MAKVIKAAIMAVVVVFVTVVVLTTLGLGSAALLSQGIYGAVAVGMYATADVLGDFDNLGYPPEAQNIYLPYFWVTFKIGA